jgi:alpha-L-rhamnosidase
LLKKKEVLMTMNSRSTGPPLVQALRCEYQDNPLGIDVVWPRLSWKLASAQRGVVQSAYQLRVTDGSDVLWDTGKVRSPESIHVPYGGSALHSGERCTWRVRVWDGHNRPSAWSEPAWWEMGLMHPSDWIAHWIAPGWQEAPKAVPPCPYLRTTFAVDGPISSARAYITALGCYELFLNGQRVGDAYFTPGYTSYHRRLQYQAYDITALLREGENAIGVILGDGWYRGKLGAFARRNTYGERLALLVQLHLRYADGREQLILSDEGWQATTGPLLSSDLQAGEIYDARLEMPGWNEPGFDASWWQKVAVVSYPTDHLVATTGPQVRPHEEIRPVALLQTPKGETVVDMGQNFAGVVRFRIQGPAGTTVRLQHGETLDAQGNFTTANVHRTPRNAPQPWQEVRYTLKGEAEEVYTPHFTFHGFRYVKVEGFPGTPSAGQFTGVALYSDLPQTGTFECSDPLVNRLHENILWSQKSNFLEIPTDCPTRERLGWTGDVQIFARTGSFLMQTASFLSKWLRDLAAEQLADGQVANIVPSQERARPGTVLRVPWITRAVPYPGKSFPGSAGWGDAAVIVPWTLYECYGDQRVLEEQYASMKVWVEFMRKQAKKQPWFWRISPLSWSKKEKRPYEPYLWETGFQFGEWLEPDESFGPKMAIGILKRLLFSAPLMATAYFARSTHLLAETARVLGKDDDAREYEALSRRITEAYRAAFIDQDGRIRPEKQASYVRALAFDLVPPALQQAAVEHLVRLIQANGDHLGTGFLSTPYLCHVLSEHGRVEVAYALLKQDTMPSWLYEVKQGATTIWETWDGIGEDGTPRESLNHYSKGAVGSWLYEVVAGIEAGAPGYKHIRFRPRPGGGLTAASARYHSLYGEIASSWQMRDGKFMLTIMVPANTTATVFLPQAESSQVTEGGQAVETAEGVIQVSQEQESMVVAVGSGTYAFAYPFSSGNQEEAEPPVAHPLADPPCPPVMSP